jgi:uncharacterized protein (TIGR02246 family)
LIIDTEVANILAASLLFRQVVDKGTDQVTQLDIWSSWDDGVRRGQLGCDLAIRGRPPICAPHRLGAGMKQLARTITIGSLALGVGAIANAADDSAVRSFEDSQQASWNAHDARAYASRFSDDAEVVNSLGWRWSGRGETERMISDGFKLVYAQSRLQTTVVTVRALSPELVSVVLKWSMTGARTPDGATYLAPQNGIESQLLQRRDGNWRILSQQDTVTAQAPALSAEGTSPAASTSPASFPTTPPPVRRCILAHGNGNCLIYGKPKSVAP